MDINKSIKCMVENCQHHAGTANLARKNSVRKLGCALGLYDHGAVFRNPLWCRNTRREAYAPVGQYGADF